MLKDTYIRTNIYTVRCLYVQIYKYVDSLRHIVYKYILILRDISENARRHMSLYLFDCDYNIS